MTTKLYDIYQELSAYYGKQNWWPLMDSKTDSCLYKKRKLPLKPSQSFEIIIGAILTQNTQFDPNVTYALKNLWITCKKEITPKKILSFSNTKLGQYIRPAGYYNQKATYLKNISQLIINLQGDIPTRKELLKIKRVGPETADSILLYAYNQPSFVIDAYTRRVLLYYRFKIKDYSYAKLQEWCVRQLPLDANLFNEFHALLVAKAKDLKNTN